MPSFLHISHTAWSYHIKCMDTTGCSSVHVTSVNRQSSTRTHFLGECMPTAVTYRHLILSNPFVLQDLATGYTSAAEWVSSCQSRKFENVVEAMSARSGARRRSRSPEGRRSRSPTRRARLDPRRSSGSPGHRSGSDGSRLGRHSSSPRRESPQRIKVEGQSREYRASPLSRSSGARHPGKQEEGSMQQFVSLKANYNLLPYNFKKGLCCTYRKRCQAQIVGGDRGQGLHPPQTTQSQSQPHMGEAG